jgi:hypothetical protein
MGGVRDAATVLRTLPDVYCSSARIEARPRGDTSVDQPEEQLQREARSSPVPSGVFMPQTDWAP